MDKKFTPQEVAAAVLAKAKEMYDTSSLAKSAKLKLSSDHDKNAHLYESDQGSSKMGSKIRSANRSKSWAKDDRSSSPSIERSMAKDRMGEAKTIASNNLAATKAQPKPNLTKNDATIAQAEQDQTPTDNVQETSIGQHDPAQGKENMNPPAGAVPGKGSHKLAEFKGRIEGKRASKAKVPQNG